MEIEDYSSADKIQTRAIACEDISKMNIIRTILSDNPYGLHIKRKIICVYEKIIDIIKTVKVYIFSCKDAAVKRKYNITVLSLQETMEKLINEKQSVSRFGDGEFKIIENRSIGFQCNDTKLCSELIDICCNPEKYQKVLVCMPGFFCTESIYTHEHWIYFRKLLINNREKWYSMLNPQYRYGNADITRCYIELKEKSQSTNIFQIWKRIWEQQNIVIVEGDKTRLGIGNDLFCNAKSISRVIAPSCNAFSYIDEVYNFILNNIDKNCLILIALGPTATVMSCRLSQSGYWTIDIGNIDKEYEWMKNGEKKKTRNPIKYSGEVKGGTEVQSCTDPNYLKEIIMRIGC